MQDFDKYTYKQRKDALKDDEQYREWICKKLLNHLREGFSIESFAVLAASTVKDVIKNHPESFDLGEIESAMNEGQANWERIGYAQANGKCLGNSRTWFYNMSNRYGWSERSKQEVESKSAVTVSIVNYADASTGV